MYRGDGRYAMGECNHNHTVPIDSKLTIPVSAPIGGLTGLCQLEEPRRYSLVRGRV